jgi:hypothetical protein
MERYDVAVNVCTAMTDTLFPRWYSFCAVAIRLGEEENLFHALIANACKLKQVELNVMSIASGCTSSLAVEVQIVWIRIRIISDAT